MPKDTKEIKAVTRAHKTSSGRSKQARLRRHIRGLEMKINRFDRYREEGRHKIVREWKARRWAVEVGQNEKGEEVTLEKWKTVTIKRRRTWQTNGLQAELERARGMLAGRAGK